MDQKLVSKTSLTHWRSSESIRIQPQRRHHYGRCEGCLQISAHWPNHSRSQVRDLPLTISLLQVDGRFHRKRRYRANRRAEVQALRRKAKGKDKADRGYNQARSPRIVQGDFPNSSWQLEHVHFVCQHKADGQLCGRFEIEKCKPQQQN